MASSKDYPTHVGRAAGFRTGREDFSGIVLRRDEIAGWKGRRARKSPPGTAFRLAWQGGNCS
jgi:hypothetical protein